MVKIEIDDAVRSFAGSKRKPPSGKKEPGCRNA